ncbi:DUF4012 domain-containing protein [Herbiconiux sp. CPCC 205763]|uniref:DUF4012 domain-containing protein n=1 Tax=Herbiconiux aconitum TaxID=2970913 RepID=A0ABT2GKK4_9MICO|nr:DUF4012 domain-containing protein [Herbiconiux aconitum]MCS5716752.1 DUF4012 domain-containing protein [Herbiconiux aconitum]
MTDEMPSRRSIKDDSTRGEKPRQRARRRRWPWVVGGVVLLLLAIVAGAVWVGTKALTVKDELEAAQPLLSTVKQKVLAGEASSAQADANVLSEHAAKAREAASGPVWWLAEQVPGVGPNLSAVRVVAETVSDVVDQAVVPAVDLGDTLSPSVFRPVDGAVDLAAIESVLPVLEQSSIVLTSAKENVGAIDTSTLIGPVKNAVDQIDSMVGEIEPALATAKSLAPVLPGLLGADGPKNYLLVFENSAEVRPLGGIAGAQILVTADQGRVTIAQQASGREFAFESEQFADSHLPREARDLFLVPFGVQSQNNTLTPRVDVAADLTRSMWQNQRGVTADTVVFVDPIALSYILDATGPITLPDGSLLNSQNSTDILMNGVYQMYAEDADAQDAYFAAVAGTAFGAIMNGKVDIPKFITAVQKAGEERRLLASSTDQIVQDLVVDAGLQGRLPQETETSHQIGVYLSDFLGSKMDYYLRTAIAVGQQQCTDGTRKVRVQVTATNILDPAAVEGLSTFITGAGGNGFRIPLGDLRVFTYVYAPEGSTIASITGSTSQEDSTTGTDQSYPVARGVIQAAPGQSQTATIDIDVSALPEKQVETLVGPMLANPDMTDLQFTC